MPLKLVPFNDSWIQHDKLDLHAIYRRPRFTTDEYGDPVRVLENGLPAWDLTGPQPVKQHNKLRAKGFEYVTLADAQSLSDAYKKGTLLPVGATPRDYAQDSQTGGPWNYRKYAEGRASEMSDAITQLRADVAKFGSAAVEELRGIELPTWLKGFNAGDDIPTGPAPEAAPSAPAPTQKVAPDSEITGRHSTQPQPVRRRKKNVAEVTQ